MIFRKYGKVFLEIEDLMAFKTSRDKLNYFQVSNVDIKVDKTGVE